MSRPAGWYWARRMSDEEWQPAYWGPLREYPGEWRWRLATYLEIHRGRLYRVGRRILEPT
jgi:hypothetical protein